MKIPVFAHNAKNYDNNFIINYLAKTDNYQLDEDSNVLTNIPIFNNTKPNYFHNYYLIHTIYLVSFF